MSADQPEMVSHPVLGELRWERQSDWWFAQVQDSTGEQIDVIVVPDEGDRVSCLDRAADLYSRAIRAERQLLATAVQNELLELYNGTWRQSDEPVLSADEFISRLQFAFIKIQPDWDCAVTLSYDAGDLFAGHAVDVELDRKLRYLDVNLIG